MHMKLLATIVNSHQNYPQIAKYKIFCFYRKFYFNFRDILVSGPQHYTKLHFFPHSGVRTHCYLKIKY